VEEFSSYGGNVLSETSGNGDAGNIIVKAGDFTAQDGEIVSFTSAGGNAGDILLEVDNLTVTEGAHIDTSSWEESTGQGGNLIINATGNVSVSGFNNYRESALQSEAEGEGDGGNILITALSLNISERGRLSASTQGNGDAGGIMVEVNTLTLTDGGQMDVSNWEGSSGEGGAMTVIAKEEVSISGPDSALLSVVEGTNKGGSISVYTPVLLLDDSGIISASTFASGEAGDITINSENLVITDGFIESLTVSDGDAGDIQLDVDNLTMTDGAQIDVSSWEGATGKGGDLTIFSSGSVSISGTDENGNSSALLSAVEGTGAGGTISVTTPVLSVMDGGEISTSTYSIGKGGNIILDTGMFDLLDGGAITAESTSTGNAGNIDINVVNIFRAENSFVTTEASQAVGGNITFNGGDILLTENSEVTASVASGEGGGGDVTIHANSLVALEDSDISARADQGFGGNIIINADVVLFSDDTNLDASSNIEGREGTVEVNSPIIDVSGGLVSLPETFLDAEALLPANCESKNPEYISSFVVLTHEGLTSGPDRLLLYP
jgi:large exoprotein involved in heme utilization and adhesion